MEITRTELIEAVVNTLREYDVDGDIIEIAIGIADSLMLPDDVEEESYEEFDELDDDEDVEDEDDDY